MITDKEIEHIAKLSRLEFNDGELKNLKQDLSKVIDYVQVLQNVNTSSVQLQQTFINAETQLRNDQPQQCFSQDQAVFNAPDKIMGNFVVPTVME